MGKSWDEFIQSFGEFKNLGAKGVWDAFINGSVEAGDALENDKKLIEEFKSAYVKDPDDKDLLGTITEQMSAQARVYVNQMDKATLSADDFAASQTRAAVAMNTLQGVGKKAIAVVGNMLTTFAITAAINLAVQAITYLVERQENLRQAALEAGSALDEQSSAINDYKTQISSLIESLDEGNLSETEAYDARKQLISIQDELVEKFGAEAAGIDLVNGKYEEQLGLLDSIANQKANEYIAQNYEAIEKAQKTMSSDHTYQVYGDRDNIYTHWTDTAEVQKLVSKYAGNGVTLDTNGVTPFSGKQNLILKITADPREAKDTIEH